MTRFIAMLFVLFSMVACRETGTASKRNEVKSVTQAEVVRLIKKSLDDMVYVEGGSFIMGDGDEDGNGLPWTIDIDNKPGHNVTLDSYYIGKYEITYRDHDIFSATQGRKLTRSLFIGDAIRADEISAGVSWFDAKDYCGWLGDQTGLPFDLPTEAQWEYAARARGKNVPYATDTGSFDMGRNFPESEDEASAPGQYPPNGLGLYNMSGNVIEWVNDWYDAEYYHHSPERNPGGPETGTLKVRRGGSFLEDPTGSNVYTRQEVDPAIEYKNVGFRCALNVTDPPETLKGRSTEFLKKLE